MLLKASLDKANTYNHTEVFRLNSIEHGILLEEASVLDDSFSICIPKYSPTLGSSDSETKSLTINASKIINKEMRGGGTISISNTLTAENFTSYFEYTFGDVKDGDMESSVGVTEVQNANLFMDMQGLTPVVPPMMMCPFTKSTHPPLLHNHDIKKPFVFNQFKFTGHNNMQVPKGTRVLVTVIGGMPDKLGVLFIRNGIPRTEDAEHDATISE